ncbi:NADPH2:quinone reductase [Lentzea albidocapillata subsp. violacea]|uniref:NADPH2:quinone reductase n=1 Tax=Lentzea albidocapillata subsp. violacea TaxID=128104 RepID=A0A1G9LRF1_9PSEU|nr:zinc-binding dehydrogenase [Lentzea albidocapillata]SDL64357.1 NADPH2:quinone reductase [Lentzea albidocapillata subsp. violacea]
MRTVRYHEHGGPAVLRVEEAERPDPGPGEVLIRAEAIGVNYAEVQRRQGKPIGGPIRLPAAPAGDVAGVVEAVGDGVTSLAVGDRVVAPVRSGAYAEYAVARASMAFPIPENVDAAQATALPSPGETAYHVVVTVGRLQPGETVLINAASGGIGHLAVQIARARGAGRIIGAVGSPAKLDFARSVGADVAVCYGFDDWTQEVAAATGDKGVDLVLETVGNEVLRQSIELTARFGRIVCYGGASGEQPPPISPWDLVDMKSLQGFNLYALHQDRPEATEAGRKELLRYLATGQVTPAVYARLSLEDAAKAHELMESRAHTGRVVLVP